MRNVNVVLLRSPLNGTIKQDYYVTCMSTKLSECKIFARGIVYVHEWKNLPSAVVQYNDLAEKRVACAYTTKNAMKIHIHCFSKSFAILFPFPVHVGHNYKVF